MPTQLQPATAQTNQVEVSKHSQGSGSLQSDLVVKADKDSKDSGSLLGLLLVGLALVGVGIAWQVIWNVKPALHTPLMSVTNAISGIIIIGSMLQLSGPLSSPTILGAIAILLGTINISGGFLVSQRMLKMFQK